MEMNKKILLGQDHMSTTPRLTRHESGDGANTGIVPLLEADYSKGFAEMTAAKEFAQNTYEQETIASSTRPRRLAMSGSTLPFDREKVVEGIIGFAKIRFRLRRPPSSRMLTEKPTRQQDWKMQLVFERDVMWSPRIVYCCYVVCG